MVPAFLRIPRVFLSLSLILLLGETTSLGAYSTGPPPGRTGAPGELTCRDGCHSSFALNSGPGRLKIEAPSSYQPEQKYRLRVILFQAGQSRWGFQLTARTSANKQAGSFSPIGSETQVITGFGEGSEFQYVEHTSLGTFPGRSATQTNPVIWEVDWTAPAKGTGTVTFYSAGNAANGDRSNSGDYIYTASVSSVENHPPVAKEDLAKTAEDSAVNIPVLANDTDPEGDTLEIVGITQGTNGLVEINPGGTVRYTPNPGFLGEDTFTYVISDGKGGESTGVVKITVVFILGDANLDGEWNTQDLVEMLRLYLGIVALPPPGSTKQRAIDADGNALFNGQDLNIFFRRLLGL